MTKVLILVSTLVVVVFAAVGWQASLDGGSAAPAREEAAAQTQEASPEPKAGPSHDGSSSASEDPAGTTQTKRLAVENMLQVGGFGCVSCTSLAAGTLRKAEGVEGLTYEPETETYLVTVDDGFRLDEAAEQIRSVSKEYNRRNGLPDSPDWVLKEI
ncbi:MAG: hypothetical protein M3N45_02640 [Actinomycetota bacterium]|nr:hypothetical protein [Actinomycetota bacterium]